MQGSSMRLFDRSIFVVVGLVLAWMLSSSSCGRLALDPGVDLAVATGGEAGTSAGRQGGRGGAGGGGGAATGGTRGSGGAPQMPTPIPCGPASCTPRTQTCCIQRTNGRRQATCVASAAACASGVTIACVDSSACAAGQVCCESVLGATTACSDPEPCALSPGLILCSGDTDCPTFAPHCCQTDGGGICAAMTCPAGGG
jgi:hypothetical protein